MFRHLERFVATIGNMYLLKFVVCVFFRIHLHLRVRYNKSQSLSPFYESLIFQPFFFSWSEILMVETRSFSVLIDWKPYTNDIVCDCFSLKNIELNFVFIIEHFFLS